jgi:hypothetical protein
VKNLILTGARPNSAKFASKNCSSESCAVFWCFTHAFGRALLIALLMLYSLLLVVFEL